MSTNFTVWCNVELGEFLLARIAEDEAAALAGISGQADPENGWGYEGRALTPHVGIVHEPIQGAHIIRWHPARVLAECEAKRRIVADRDMFAKMADDAKGDLALLATSRGIVRGLDHAIATLALAHAGHPDWREEWRP